MTWIPASADVLIDIARARYCKLLDSSQFVYLATPGSGDEIASNNEIRDLVDAGYAEVDPLVRLVCVVNDQWCALQPVFISTAGETLLQDYFGYREPPW